MAVVLVVEDDLAVAHALCRHLEQRGHTALSAASASQALTVGTSRQPNAVILDLRLPDGDGLALFGELRYRSPILVGVMLTGFGTIASAVASMKAGMADYIEKPADLIDLVERIENLVDRSLSLPTQPVHSLASSAPAMRVAEAIARAMDSPEPPRTLAAWGRSAGAARGTLRTWCQCVGVHPHDALSLTRGLWAIKNASHLGTPPAELLGYLDVRSAREFVARSGLAPDRWQTMTPVSYCREQRFCRHKVIVAELVRLLSDRASRKA